MQTALTSAQPALAAYEGRPIVLGIRPEGLEDAALVDGDPPRLRGRAELREALGPEVLLHFSVAARPAVTDDVRELAEDVGDDRPLDRLASESPPKTTLVGRFNPQTRSARATRSRSRSTSAHCTSSTQTPAWRSSGLWTRAARRPPTRGSATSAAA